MVCPRCGAAFEGNFCPRCGLAAAGPAAPPTGIPCPRCGALIQGNFCPRCGLPASAAAYLPARPIGPPPSSGRSLLSVVWILAIAAVFFLIVGNVLALALSPGYVLPGLQGMTRGTLPDSGLDNGVGNWTFVDLGSVPSAGAYSPTGGNPGGALEISLSAGNNVGGMWEVPFQASGSTPFAAAIQLDVQVQSSGSGPSGGRLLVSVESASRGFDAANASTVWLNGTRAWTQTEVLDATGGLGDPGTYFLKVAFLAASNPQTTTVGLDNIRFGWGTDAYFYVIGPIPLPTLLVFSRDPGTIEASYYVILAAILIPVGYYAITDRRFLARAVSAPLADVGTRLRSMSAWVAIAQTWLAANFFQFMVIFAIAAAGGQTTAPINITSGNAWFYLYDLARASVFEELLFRALLIGVPMALGAALWRAANGTRGGVLSALKYLWGGQLRAESSREALVVGGLLVLASSVIFGVQHYVGWGWWKTLPAAIFGLALGYVFVRHGIGAAILLHFLNDYLSSLILEGAGGLAYEAVFGLLLYALIAVGAGFFAWYVIDGWQHLQAFRGRRAPHVLRQAVPAAAAGGGTPVWTAPPSPSQPSAAPMPVAPGWGPPAGPVPPRSLHQLPHGYVPMYRPPPFGFPPVRFQCPACGWVEAKYENRRFTCLRCGRTA